MAAPSLLAYGPESLTKYQLEQAVYLGIPIPQGLLTQEGYTILPHARWDVSHRPLQEVVNLQRQPNFRGIDAGNSSRKCDEASFTGIAIRAGEYDEEFIAESQRLTTLAKTQAVLKKKQLRESLAAEEQAQLDMPRVQCSHKITLRFGGAELHRLHEQRFEGLELDGKVTDNDYDIAAKFQCLTSSLSRQSIGETSTAKRGFPNETMAHSFQQWLPQDKRSLFLTPAHITSSLKVSPHKADLNIVEIRTISSHAASSATSTLTSLSPSDDGEDVDISDGDGKSSRDTHVTNSSANLPSSHVVSEPSSSSCQPSSPSQAGSSAPSTHWPVSSGIKRDVRMKACLDYQIKIPIEEGQAFGAFLEDLHKKGEGPLKFYIKFDGETYEPSWTLETEGRFDNILIQCCQILGCTSASNAIDAILTDLEHYLSFVRSSQNPLEYLVSGFNSCNYPLLPLHKVLLSTGLSPAPPATTEDRTLVQIYESDVGGN